MLVSQKCQYALRALFELSKRYGQGPVKNADIAEAQAIPSRFLEVILGQLRRAGFVESRRGNAGGYYLTRDPASMTVGDVIRVMQGPVGPVVCVGTVSAKDCPLYGNCVFLPMWQKAKEALLNVYDSTTFQSLVDEELESAGAFVPCYTI
jgi:Rrf2 family protein